jgi:VIT1/CCC1 family predicted Fe2+/Mn2+ transporter
MVSPRKHRRLGRRVTFRHHLRPKHLRAKIAERTQAAQSRIEAPVPIATPETLPELPSDSSTITSDSPIVGGQPLQHKHSLAEDLHDWILGGQDGLVNVLGSILGVAIVTQEQKIILVVGLAALFAESISMAAVAYTSVKASHSYFVSEREAQRKAIEENPQLQHEILVDIYHRKGLKHEDAVRVANDLAKDKNVWLDTLMEEHLRMYPPDETGPLHSAMIVGTASVLGSLVPLLPFFFLTGMQSIIVSAVVSIIVLFFAGAASAKLTIGDWKARGLELMLIGGTAAAVSVAIGYLFASGIIAVG